MNKYVNKKNIIDLLKKKIVDTIHNDRHKIVFRY